MKGLFFILGLVCFFSGTNDVVIRKATVKVDGFTCSMCGLSVEKSLQTLSFVKSVETDLQSATMYLTFKPNFSVNPELIGKKVKAAGFSVSSLTYYFDESVSTSGSLEIQGFRYGICRSGNSAFIDSARVVGKNLISGKELNLIRQTNSCEDLGYSYWLLPY